MTKKQITNLTLVIVLALAVMLAQKFITPYFIKGIFRLTGSHNLLQTTAIIGVLAFIAYLFLGWLIIRWFTSRNQVILRKGKKGNVRLNGYRVWLCLNDVKIVSGQSGFPWIEVSFEISTYRDGMLDNYSGKFKPDQNGECQIFPLEPPGRAFSNFGLALRAKWLKDNRIRFELVPV
jgi:hypothetical protein